MADNCLYFLTEPAALSTAQMFFMSMGIVPFVLLIPSCIIAKFVWWPMKRDGGGYESDDVEEPVNEPVKEVPYEQKYPLKPSIKQVKPKINNIVMENGPFGNIAMRYNTEEKGFEYWVDGQISYRQLETVARKYVNMFGCSDIYIDRDKQFANKIVKLQSEISKNIEVKKKKLAAADVADEAAIADAEKTGGGAFATLKKYNRTVQDDKEKEALDKDDFVCDVANKYINKGKFTDNDEWMIHRVETVVPDTGVLSWLSWKDSNAT